MDSLQNESPHVSIIIPTYNRAPIVCRAIESALAQTYPHCEVIVVDDGSKDNTLTALTRYEGWITVIRQSNRGRSAARNVGLEKAQGEYVVFLDSDDMLTPDMVIEHLKVAIRVPSAAIITGLAWMTDSFGRPIKPVVLMGAPLDHPAFLSLVFGNVPLIHTVLAKRSVLDEVGGFDESLQVSEDWDLWLRVVARHPDTGFVSQPCAYCSADPSLGADRLEKYQVQTHTPIIIENAFNFLPADSPFHTFKPVALARAHVQWGACVEFALGHLNQISPHLEAAQSWLPELTIEMDVVPRGVAQFATWYQTDGDRFIQRFFAAVPSLRVLQGQTLALYYSKQAYLALHSKRYIDAVALTWRAIFANPWAVIWAGRRIIQRFLR